MESVANIPDGDLHAGSFADRNCLPDLDDGALETLLAGAAVAGGARHQPDTSVAVGLRIAQTVQ